MKFNFEKWQWKFSYLMFGLTAVIGAITLQNYEALTMEFLICMFLTILSYSNMVVYSNQMNDIIIWHEHKYEEEE